MKKNYTFLWLLFLSQSIQILSCCSSTKTRSSDYYRNPSRIDAFERFKHCPTEATLNHIQDYLNKYKTSKAFIERNYYLHRLCMHAKYFDPEKTDHLAYYVKFLDILVTQHHVNIHQEDDEGNTPLHLQQSIPIIKKLAYYGANFNARNKKGETPLHLMMREDGFNIPQELFTARTICKAPSINEIGWENGFKFKIDIADVNAQDNEGCTPLHITDHPEVMALLIKNKANVNKRNKDGSTPLHTLCSRLVEAINYNQKDKREQYFKMLAMLLSAGANTKIKSKYNTTALDHPEVIQFIENFYTKRAYAALIEEGGRNTGLFTTMAEMLNFPNITEEIF